MVRHIIQAVIAVTIVGMLAAPAAAAEIAVIVNKNNTNEVTRDMIERIYKAELGAWPGGSSTAIFDLPDNSETRAAFTQQLLGKSVSAIKALWTVKLFSGKATPPKVLNSDADMKSAVAGNPNAIGYIKASNTDSSVKVVLTLQ